MPALCPNDRVDMHPVRIESHYGQQIIVDQCKTCGGIWFDESELFRAKQGEAERVELLDVEVLSGASEVKASGLLCPKDGAGLFRFSDKHFPEDVVLVRCPTCRGVWLNRGGFAAFQKRREERLRPQEVWLGADGRPGPAPAETPPVAASREEMLRKIGTFLSTELDQQTMRPLDPSRMSPGEQKTFDTTMNVVMSLLGLLALRR